MMISSFLFKQKAKNALRGNWQTALLVTFFSTIFVTVADVLQQVSLNAVNSVMNSLSYALNTLPQTGEITSQQSAEVMQLYSRLFAALDSIPDVTWIAMIAANVLSILLTPVLTIGCNRYFICRNLGEELGFREGLLGRMRSWGKAMWLYILMGVKVFLWSLLFIIPGIIAGLRYSMAPYYLAEDPTLTARQAIAKSKEVMKDKKMSYFMLQLSFVALSIMISFAQMLLGGLLGTVLMLVAAQFMSLALSTYMNASYAAFYCSISRPSGMDDLLNAMRSRMREAGMSEEDINSFDEYQKQDDNNNDTIN